jgi:hypothetical protein
MERSKIKIWTPSGCLSKEAIAAWYGNSFSRSEKYVIKLHLDECPFCKDAVEGYSLLMPEQTQRNLDYIREQFNTTIYGEEKKTNARSKKLIISLAAAIVITFICVYSLIKILPNRTTSPVAQNIEKEAGQKTDTNQDAKRNINEAAPAIARENAPEKIRSKTDDDATNSYVTDSVVEMPAPAVVETESSPMLDETIIAEAKPAEEEKSLYKEESAGYVSKREISERRAEHALKVDKPASYKKMSSSVTENSLANKPAMFQDGDISKFKTYVEDKLAVAIKDKQASPGIIIVSFTVDTKGKAQNIVIEKAPDKKTNSEVTGIIKNSPKWVPAQQNDKAIESTQFLTLEGK